MDECEHDVPAGGYFSPKLYLQRYLFIGFCLFIFITEKNLRYEFVKKLIDETNSKSVLDLGCGEGSFLKEVTKLNSLGFVT